MAAVTLGVDEPEKVYALAQKEWSKDRRLTKDKEITILFFVPLSF